MRTNLITEKSICRNGVITKQGFRNDMFLIRDEKRDHFFVLKTDFQDKKKFREIQNEIAKKTFANLKFKARTKFYRRADSSIDVGITNIVLL